MVNMGCCFFFSNPQSEAPSLSERSLLLLQTSGLLPKFICPGLLLGTEPINQSGREHLEFLASKVLCLVNISPVTTGTIPSRRINSCPLGEWQKGSWQVLKPTSLCRPRDILPKALQYSRSVWQVPSQLQVVLSGEITLGPRMKSHTHSSMTVWTEDPRWLMRHTPPGGGAAPVFTTPADYGEGIVG